MGKKKRNHNKLDPIPDIEYNKLVKVCSIQSHSSDETFMVKFITDWLSNNNIKFIIDNIGNILVTKGNSSTYPCVVAHLDTVHSIIEYYKLYSCNIVNKSKEILDTKLFARTSKDGISYDLLTGIGGDDKCGIYTCIYMLEHLPIVKVVFFTKEEVGCQGSDKIDKHFFDDCRYIIQLDRRCGSDFIDKHWRGNTTSDKFRSEIGHLKKERGFKSTTGIMTDSINLWQDDIGISCCNISCGYYEPHTDNEYIMVNELWNSVQLTYEIITILKSEKYESHPPKVKYYNWRDDKDFDDYQTCFLCHHVKLLKMGFSSSEFNHQFVCYKCYSDYFNKDMKQCGETIKQSIIDPWTKKELTYGLVKIDECHRIEILCSICGKYKPSNEGKYTDKESIYSGAFVCNRCNIDVDENGKEIEAVCHSCLQKYTNPYYNGEFVSTNPEIWLCDNCLKNDKNEKEKKLNKKDGDYCLIQCENCLMTVPENQGRPAPEHDCEYFLCDTCRMRLYGEY